ncbi:MAG: alanine racemase [Desulfarculaceae bacterium]|nr:alanine racemase [Desulfarculaceae bacterium]MCF8071024.1 alanine racemase [Desulfarculaceae bacterium]MCF8100612.1 alanine racemase [Desulfarculaceae bacterium]MCF8116954.1 alanine racemase [Desulfarculaceae bacterium]
MTRVAPNPDNLVTVDLDAVASNLAALRALLAPGLGVAGVVKADAYGHGMLPVARRLKAEGAEALAVAVPREGVLLRRAGVQGPILVMMGLAPNSAPEVAAHRLTPFLSTMEEFAALSQAAQALGREASCHLKVDTGMSRLGAHTREALELLNAAAALPGLRLEGLASHLATSGNPGDGFAQRQARAFGGLLDQARQQGHALPQSSLAASGGVLAPPQGAPGGPGLARLGISLYGGLPHQASQGRAELRGAMRCTSRLALVKRVPPGACVSYGCTWEAPRDTWLGVVAAGYSDGYPRSASNQGAVLINGRLAPIRGRVCMNAFMVELTGLDPLPQASDEVVLLGSSGDAEISADQLGQWAKTISYEITCSLGAANRRVHRP